MTSAQTQEQYRAKLVPKHKQLVVHHSAVQVRDACAHTVWVGYAGSATLRKGRRQHQAQEVGCTFLHLVVGGRELALRQLLLQHLIDEEADHGLRDAGVGRSQASVEASDSLRLVNIAGALQGVHLLLPSGSVRSNRLFTLAGQFLIQFHTERLQVNTRRHLTIFREI